MGYGARVGNAAGTHDPLFARALYLAAQILRDWNEAEDVVQEAFLRVFHSIRRFRREAAFFSWLYRIVMNVASDRARSRAAKDCSNSPLSDCSISARNARVSGILLPQPEQVINWSATSSLQSQRNCRP